MNPVINFYPHQTDALTKVKDAIVLGNGSAIGRIVIPTGGGKTFVEAATLSFVQDNFSKSRIHLVTAPRIVLANQLIKEYRTFSGTKYRVIAFHSGSYEPDYTKIKWKEENTTQVEVVKEAYINAIKCNQDLVIFSTYNSCHKLAGIDFDSLICDESQYCVAENFHDAIHSITARFKGFFTATEKHTASNAGRGLNNKSLYGERIYEISPAELIRLQLIVPPRLHVMHGNAKNIDSTVISEVLELAQAQDKLTRPEIGFSKILFAMNGTDDVKTVEDCIKKIQVDMSLHDIFTITSKTGAKVNGVKVPREQFLEKLKTSINALIFHYDILSEGIDVDGITGVCLLRNMGLAKLLQTIGRAVRIYKPNPLLKKQAWVSVSVINGNEDDKVQVKIFIEAIRNAGFDISAENVVETGTPRHTPDEKGGGDAYGALKSNFSSMFITEIFHEVEDNDFWDQVKSAGNVGERLDKFEELFSTLEG